MEEGENFLKRPHISKASMERVARIRMADVVCANKQNIKNRTSNSLLRGIKIIFNPILGVW